MADQEAGEEFVPEPDVAVEAEPADVSTVEDVSPDPVAAYLAKYGGDTDKALRAAVEAQSFIGRQAQELGELRRALADDPGEEWQADVEPDAVYDWQADESWSPESSLSPDELAFAQQLQTEQAGQQQAELEQILAEAPPEFVEFVGSSALDEMLSMPLYAPDARAVIGGNAQQKAEALARLFVANQGRTAQQLADASRLIARQTAIEAQQMADDAFVVSTAAPVAAEKPTWAQQEAADAHALFQRHASAWDEAASWHGKDK